MMSGMACHHFLWKAHIGGRRRTWHAIMALGHHTRSDDVKFVMPLSPLDYTHDRAMSSMACLSSPWTSHMVGQRRAGLTPYPLDTRSDDVGHGMSFYALDDTHDRTK